MEGDWLNYIPEADGNRKLLIDSMIIGNREAEVIKRKDIPEYLNTKNVMLIKKYYLVQKYGLPYNRGWAEQPCITMDILNALDEELLIIKSNRGKNGG